MPHNHSAKMGPIDAGENILSDISRCAATPVQFSRHAA
jgi:hypothetical protein